MPTTVNKYCLVCGRSTPHLPGGDPLKMYCTNGCKPVSEEGEKNKGLGEEFDLWDYVKREYQLLRMNGNSENEAFNKISGRYNITVKP